MASNFDRSKYKDTFEKRYGSGAYDSGLSKARDIGVKKAQAQFEEAKFNARMSEVKSEQKKVAKKKKEEEDNLKLLQEAKAANEKKESLKKNGFDFIPKNVTKPFKNLFTDFAKAGKQAAKAVNPFDDIGFGDAMLKNAMEFDKEKSKTFDSVARGTGRTANTASFGLMGNLDKKMRDGETPHYLTKRKFGEGGGTDMISDGLGYLVPGSALARGLRGTKLGANTALKALSKGGALTRGKEGAIVGAIMGGTEVGGRELLNPDDANWKQNLGQIGLETAAGGVADPLLAAGGSLLKSGVNKIRGKKPPTNKLKLDDIDSSEVPFTVDEPKNRLETLLPTINQTAATTAKKRPDLDLLMKAYRGEDVENIPVKKYDPSIIARQVDDMPKKATDSVLDTPAIEANYTKGIDATQLKDISGFKGATSDVYRIFDDVLGKGSETTKRILGELDNSKAKYVDMQEGLLKGLKENVVDKLGIKKGSKLSRYVQDYGEGNMDLPTLMAKAPKDWEKVLEANTWLRKTYDETIDVINASRAKAYPGDESKLVPKRKDYFRHYQELTGLSGLKNLFDTPTAIDPHLAGTSEFTKPGSKFAGFMQRRGMGPYKSDAVGGFLNYAPSAAYATHIDPNIKNIRALRSELADITVDSRNINNFIGFLDKFSNDLAGKTNPYLDRNVQDIIGRKPMAFLNWMNGRVKTNTILGNLSSTLAQVANVPMAISFAKQHAAKGVSRTMKSLLDKSEPIHKSAFMKERYSDAMYREFDERLIEQPLKFAEWIIESTDRVGSSFVWNSAYEKGLKQGAPNPIKYADENTRRLIAGRGVGEVPLLQKSKVVQMVMPFTLEVGNQWYVMRDIIKSKDVGGLALLLIGNHVLNNVMEEVRGTPVTFDPIDATKEAIDDGLSPARVGGRLGGEVLSNVPGGQYLAGLYPEDGVLGGLKGPTRKDLFEDRNPQRFGEGLVLQNGITDPLFKLIPPFGGAQLKKTLGGLEALQNGGSYKDGKGILSALPFMGETNELNFPIEKNRENITKGLLFGPYATNEAKEYFDKERRPLSGKQTSKFKEAEALGLGKESYELLMETRLKNTEKDKLNKAKKDIKALEEDTTLTDKERKERIQKVLEVLGAK